MYTELNEKIEQITKWIYIGIQVSIVSTVLPPLLQSLTNYFIYDLHDESFQEIQMMYVFEKNSLFSNKKIVIFHFKAYALFSFLRLPFNHKTLFGYMCCYVFQAVGNACICFSTVPTNVFIIGTCLLINSFVDDIKNDLPKLKVRKSSNGKARKMKEHFGYIVKMYSDIKQLSRNSIIDK